MRDARAVAGQAKLVELVRTSARPASPGLVPELRLHLAGEVTPVWEATEAALARSGVDPPYWAFAWAGGQALARHVLDRPALVRGRRVLDVAAGSGLVALAAARAGAATVVANDVDPVAGVAIRLNAELSGVEVEVVLDDLLDGPADRWEVVLAGDVCYERDMARRMLAWLRRCARAGATVLLGDPGRAFVPGAECREVARYDVPTSGDVEGAAIRSTAVLELFASEVRG